MTDSPPPRFECDCCGLCCSKLIVEADELDLLREPRLIESDPHWRGQPVQKVLHELETEYKVIMIACGRPCTFGGRGSFVRRVAGVFLRFISMIQADIFQAIKESESFSDKVKKLNRVEEECPCCGHKVVSYRLKLRAQLIPALWELANSERALSIAELADQFAGAQARYVADYFAEIRLWGLALKEGNKWRITGEGRAFLSGNARIPQYKWQRDKGRLPPTCIDGPLVAVHELDGQHAHSDKRQHADASCPIVVPAC